MICNLKFVLKTLIHESIVNLGADQEVYEEGFINVNDKGEIQVEHPIGKILHLYGNYLTRSWWMAL